MNRLSFLLAKLSGNDMALAALSDDWDRLADDLAGRRIAIVGNARALSQTTQGDDIDATDIVIRLNTAPTPNAASHGQRTDWIATSIALPADLLSKRAPKRLLWMTPRRKRLGWAMARHRGFYLSPAKAQQELMQTLGTRPSTGVMVLDLLRRSPAKEVNVHGFDFFSSLSLSGKREVSQVPHDFDFERTWFEDLMARDNRFVFHRM